MADRPLHRGDQVRLIADPSRIGIVTSDAQPYSAGVTYEVFFGPRDTQHVNARALVLVEPNAEILSASKTGFLAALLVTKLSNKLGDVLYAYQASRTQFEPYQFKPVFKYLDAPVPGILIADEVGLGKTIEAAILYQELKARVPISRVLVVCPAGLRDKWRLELLSRFDEDFAIFRSPDVTRDLLTYRETDGGAPVHAIVGLETIRLQAIQDTLETYPVRFDLVIIDEAHHLRNPGTMSNRIAERLADMTDHLILLTATPLQTGQQDLYSLMRLIDETQFPSLGDFSEQLEPNAFLNSAIAALRRRPPDRLAAASRLEEIQQLPAGGQVIAHPAYRPTIRALRAAGSDRRSIVELQRDIDRMNVMSPIYTRTRKRDVTGIAQRQAHVIHVPITDEERDFYDMVLEHAREQARAHSASGWIPGFAGMMRERQAASCIAATRAYLLDQLHGGSADLLVEDSNSELEAPTDNGVDPRSVTERLLAAAARVGNRDSKFDVFLQALQAAMAEGPASKIIIFSYFRRTLSYLEDRLKDAGIRTIQINGSVPPAERTVLIDRFRTRQELRVLLTSEVGSEGLDFQFCDTLMNYDLPWNPMRVEQRIGRIDRYGQTAEKIRVYSFFLGGTIEERILERLYDRIGIFERSVGDLEPILGPLAQQLTRDLFATELTPEQESARLEQMLTSLEVRKLAEEDLEKRTAELLGQDALILQAVQDTVSSGRYISAAELRAVVEAFMAEATLNARLEDHVGNGTVLVCPDGQLASLIGDHILGHSDYRPGTTTFLQRLNAGERVPATFDGEQAALNRRLELLNLRHPLVRAAIAHARQRAVPYTPVTDLDVGAEALGVQDLAEPGVYRFAIELFDVRSALPQTRLETFVFDHIGARVPALERTLLRTIQEHGRPHAGGRWTEGERDELETLVRRSAAAVSDQLEASAIERNDATIAVRSATLRRTYESRIAKRNAQIARATDERIVRMWRSEVRRAEEERARKLAELEATRDVVVTFTAVGYGRLHLQLPDSKRPEPEKVTEPAPTPVPGPGPIDPYPEPPPKDVPWA